MVRAWRKHESRRSRTATALSLALPLAASALAREARADVPADGTHAPTRRRRLRTRANYDGRPARGPDVGDALLWVPRVALFPAYLVAEYGVRAPVGWLIQELERHHVVQRLEHLARPTPGLLVVPSLVVDLGLITSAGFLVAWDHGVSALRVRGATGGLGYWLGSLSEAVALAPGARLVFHADYLERSDWRFYGLGPASAQRDEQQFNWARTDAGVALTQDAGRHARLELAMGVRVDRFGAPALRSAENAPVLPTADDKSAWYYRARGFVDTRGPRAPDSSGVRLEGAVTFVADAERHPARRWIDAEAEAAVFLEVAHPGRVLGLRAWGAMIEPVAGAEVPVVDLINLGGFESMRGWLLGRFRGYSAAVFTASYRYPVWHSLDGTFYAEAGNAFERGFAGFDLARLHGSFGAGFRTTGDRDSSIDVLVALGTSRFDAPFAVESVRLAVGVNRGF